MEDDEFDDFGEFEEFDAAQPIEHDPALVFSPSTDSIARLQQSLHDTLNPLPLPSPTEKTFDLDQRCQDVYSRLVHPPMNVRQVNWKRSLLRRKLLVSLGIPIDLDEVLPSVAGAKMSKLYDQSALQGLQNNVNAELETRISQVSVDETRKDEILSSSDSVLESIHSRVQPKSFYQAAAERGDIQEKTKELENVRDELLKLAACWNLRLEDLKQDNEIYSMYVENLVGNTQKRRREEKKELKGSS
ncbi:hypothetical protein OGAPHI_002159 [Ogataea philodendri]|uniref:Uncharacterized protein n=1 Tax=Ogataea philodendri TaxID=1378263 RepID=A0A9P8T7P8_9ASCO|nr:uncharacterized protein OGAPHI_002159 [Ogataea philodendri]KAH3668405.1 hypothetical protein OGAPHI_002159 [Ogataea philodendri]